MVAARAGTELGFAPMVPGAGAATITGLLQSAATLPPGQYLPGFAKVPNMATANKAPKAPKAAPVAPVATTPAPVAPTAAPVAPTAAPVAPVAVAGVEVTLTKSQMALTAAKHGGRVMAGQVGKAYVVGSKPYRVRTPTNLAQWNAVLAAIAAGGGRATVEGMVAQGFPLTLAAPFVAYATNRGWLAEA